ncbi:hypothetical protein SFHH103_psfHH103d_307 (plasmid) [Sinorhizobium fredii HH103]|nr:hypothetical protein SFHH103_psfHH103d_307 [Sinorhizobium fredii HH103]
MLSWTLPKENSPRRRIHDEKLVRDPPLQLVPEYLLCIGCGC